MHRGLVQAWFLNRIHFSRDQLIHAQGAGYRVLHDWIALYPPIYGNGDSTVAYARPWPS